MKIFPVSRHRQPLNGNGFALRDLSHNVPQSQRLEMMRNIESMSTPSTPMTAMPTITGVPGGNFQIDRTQRLYLLALRTFEGHRQLLD